MNIIRYIFFMFLTGTAILRGQDTTSIVLPPGQAGPIIQTIVNDHELMLMLMAAIRQNDHAMMMVDHLLGGGSPETGHDPAMMREEKPRADRPETGGKSPYAGEETRSIKALSDEEIGRYVRGEGMGLAKAAELNDYPGPKHLLELAEKIGLSGDQQAKLQSEFDRMHRNAVALGEQIVEKERLLDRLFAEGNITPENLRTSTTDLGRLGGELRATHLIAHLAARSILTDEQLRRYSELRGYSGMDHSHHK